MSGLEISTDVLRQAGQQLGQVCGQLEGELNKLEQELQSFGDAWGNDDIGQLIGVAYKEVVSYAFDCLRDVLHEMCDSGTDLINQANHWDEKEQGITRDFESFLGQIGVA